jgi:hypothetical protein
MIRKSALKQWQPELMQGRSSGNLSSLTEGLGMGMAANGGLSSQAARDQRLKMRRLHEEGFLEKERLSNIGSFRLNQYNRPSTEVEDFKSPYLNDVAGYNQDTGVTVYDQTRSDKKEFNTNSLAYNSLGNFVFDCLFFFFLPLSSFFLLSFFFPISFFYFVVSYLYLLFLFFFPFINCFYFNSTFILCNFFNLGI